MAEVAGLSGQTAVAGTGDLQPWLECRRRVLYCCRQTPTTILASVKLAPMSTSVGAPLASLMTSCQRRVPRCGSRCRCS
jgi:hypothetical protein